MRLRRGFALPLAALAAAILLLGCGSDSERELEGEPFTSTEVTDWTNVLSQIDELSVAGDCEGADDRLNALQEAVEMSESDEGLKTDLISLLDDLDTQLAEDCAAEPETTSTSSSTEETESIPTTTETETTTTDEEPTTTDEEPPETTTPPSTTPPATPTPPSNGGGVPPDTEGGISPGDFESGRKSPTS